MCDLETILQDETVAVVETTVEFDAAAFDRWQTAVEEERNRAVAGIIRDEAGRLLLVRYHDEGRHEGWRLPGSRVGAVEAFETRLHSELGEHFDVTVESVRPSRVHAHTATHDGEKATFYYVLCAVDPGESPRSAAGNPPGSMTTGWFGEPPDDLVNPDVVAPLFDG